MGFFGGVIVLLGLWLLLSGIYTPMIVGFGVVSSLIAVAVVARMNRVDGDRLFLNRLHPLKFPLYLVWLLKEIAKANWAVTKIVMSPTMPIRQHLFSVRHSQKTDLGQVIFANSITLTPGTITVETEPDWFLVHALAYTHDTMGELGDMDARVTATEGGA